MKEQADGTSISPLQVIDDKHQWPMVGQYLEYPGVLGKEVCLPQVSMVLPGSMAGHQRLELIQLALVFGCSRFGTSDQSISGKKTVHQVWPNVEQCLNRVGYHGPQALGIASAHCTSHPPSFDVTGQ
jgi:hypothetical protein